MNLKETYYTKANDLLARMMGDVTDEEEVKEGSIKGPGNPDGTGPAAGTPECPLNPEKNAEEEISKNNTTGRVIALEDVIQEAVDLFSEIQNSGVLDEEMSQRVSTFIKDVMENNYVGAEEEIEGGQGACGGTPRRDGSGGGVGNQGTPRQPKS